MEVSHLLYKVNNIYHAVDFFRKLGFEVCYGKKKNPYNALIYFQDKTYIELIENVNMNRVIKIFLYLTGKKDFANGLANMEKLEEGFIRFSFHIEKNKINNIATICNDEFKEKTYVRDVKRKDVTGNKLSCSCIFPYNSKLPFFNTRLEGNEDLWKIKHENQIIGIESIVYETTGREYDFIKRFANNSFINLVNANGGVKKIRFKYADNSIKKQLVFEEGWRTIKNENIENIDKFGETK